ncbi:MAG: trigger factor [Bacilli bacterium]|nr:trigger factor [Bacilli bacterium]
MAKNVKEIEIKLEGKEWETCLDKAFKKKNKDTKIDGFRKGQAPKDMFIKKFGIESLYMEAVDFAIDAAYKKALDDAKVIPVIEPKLDVKNIDEKSVTFMFTIITKPEVKLGEYKKLGIKKEKAKATKAEIDAEVEALRTQCAEIVVKGEKEKVAEKDTAVIDFEGFVDGKPLEGGKGENFPLEIGSHSFIPGFEEGLVGMKSGETKELNLEFPKDYVKDLAGKKVKFNVTVHEIKTRKLPELGEEFYKDLGYEDMKTEEEFRKEVENVLVERKQRELDDKFLDECLEKAANNMKVDINDEIIDDEIHRMIHEVEHKLQMQGLTIDQYYEFTGLTHEKMHEQMHDEAVKRIKYRYLIESVADAEKIDFTQKEVDAKADEMAKNYGVTKEELLKAYGSDEVVKYDMKMHKALEIIKENN